MTTKRLEQALVTAAKVAFLIGADFDCGPMLDVLQAELDKANADNQFDKARAILAAYR
ncbi:MAG: hypothetical protein JSR99_03585 [Proteobacteria bacterium]|nr:hypothetical protein [Pseudomonadota bacterium]